MAKVGISDFYYAKVLTDVSGGATTYETPVHIPNINSADIKPASNSATVYGDNAPVETATSLGEVTVTIDMVDIPLKDQAAILGHTVTAGVMTCKASDVAPYVAVGFKALKSSGKFEYIWLYKGQFQELESSTKTKADKVEFQLQPLTGKFVVRQSDGAWIVKADEDAADYVATTGSGWFTAVHQ